MSKDQNAQPQQDWREVHQAIQADLQAIARMHREETKRRLVKDEEAREERRKEDAERRTARDKEDAKRRKARDKEAKKERRREAKRRKAREKEDEARQKKGEAQIAQINATLDRVGERLDKVGERLDKVGERLDATGKKLDAAAAMIGSYGNNIGSVTEAEFFSSFQRAVKEENSVFRDVTFTQAFRGQFVGTEHQKYEVDIVLFNAEICFVVEVKYRCHPNDIERYQKKAADLITYLGEGLGKKRCLFGIASHEFVGNAHALALKQGWVVVETEGRTLRIDASAVPKVAT